MSQQTPGDNSLPAGVYERLVDEDLVELFQGHPEVISSFSKLDDEAQPHFFSQFVGNKSGRSTASQGTGS